MLVEVTREQYAKVMQTLEKAEKLTDKAGSTITMSVMDTYLNGKMVGRTASAFGRTYYLDDSIDLGD